MKHWKRMAMGLLLATLALAGCGTRPATDWVTLIDGASGMDNFIRTGDANWRAEGDAIVADSGKGGFLITKNAYRDFQIHAEFWADTTTNSGIFIRISDPDPSKVGSKNSYEVNIYDQRPEPAYGTGAIVDFAKVNPMPKAGQSWNTYEIIARGNRLIVRLNGVETANVRDGSFTRGPIALQFANGPKDAPGGAIKWRKLRIKEML